MSVRRALVHCAVLSLQDTCVFYPCCKGCFSRIDAEQQDTTRFRCCKCGYRCLREQVEYRYRLSLRVTRDKCIFGVTVFGNSLNQFFGIHASGLQKLVEVDPSTRSTLLVKAVKDCFIGRHFIFGIKLSGTENGRLFEGLLTDGPNIRDAPQFIASQMILPQTTSLTGCTVVRYYECLLQKASELEPDCSRSCRLSASTLFLIPSQSPTSSFGNSTLFASGFLSQSLLRSKHQDCTLSPTPPWQQSLGLVTSSAEQEESRSTQDSGGEDSRHKDNSTSFPAERGCRKSHKVTKEKIPPLPLELRFYDSPSFAKNSNSSVRNVVGNSLSVNTWCSPSQPDQKNCSLTQKEFSTRQHTRTLLSSSLAWEDLPFSESLAEFLCDENKNVGETGPNLNVNCQNKVTKTFLEDTKLAGGSSSASQKKVQITSNSLRSPDATSAPPPGGGDGRDLSDQACETPVKWRHEARNITSDDCNQEDDKASLCFDEEEEHHEGNSYNCSADLFSNSFMIGMNPETGNVDADILKTATDTGTPFSKTDCQHLTSKCTNVSHITPHKREEKKTKSRIRNSFNLQETLEFEFVPPSQSTPVVKVNLKQSPSFKNLTGASAKENLTPSITFSARSRRLASEKRFSKPDGHKTHLQTGQHAKLQRRNLKLESVKTLNPKHDLQASDVTVCNLEDEEGIVAPTPSGKTQLSMSLGRRQHADISRSDLGSSWRGRREDEADCKRPVLDQTLTSSHKSLPQKGDEAAFEGIFSGSNVYLVVDESQTRDWSRDLFSDSI